MTTPKSERYQQWRDCKIVLQIAEAINQKVLGDQRENKVPMEDSWGAGEAGKVI
jgi:hypothetical protein